MKLIQNKDLLTSMHKYMFMQSTMKYAPMKYAPLNKLPVHVAMPVQVALPYIPAKQNNTKPFVPFQKDKLFWCFYIILHGYEEYEMIRSNAFSVEKQIKIKTVEKLKSIKDQLKELKLKRTELEDELVNKQMITTKGLCALCLVHNVSITYIFGRKYCEIAPKAVEPADAVKQAEAVEPADAVKQAEAVKQGIIVQNEKKEDSLKWTSNELHKNEDFLTQIRADYWLIENIQKPLNAPSAYTLPELQEIANKLQISTHIQVNEKNKAKTKTALYEEILQTI